MPRFFFDSSDDVGLVSDEDGLELANLEQAKSEALAALPDLLREIRSRGHGAPCSVTSIVRTEAGQPVFQATLSLQSRDLA